MSWAVFAQQYDPYQLEKNVISMIGRWWLYQLLSIWLCTYRCSQPRTPQEACAATTPLELPWCIRSVGAQPAGAPRVRSGQEPPPPPCLMDFSWRRIRQIMFFEDLGIPPNELSHQPIHCLHHTWHSSGVERLRRWRCNSEVWCSSVSSLVYPAPGIQGSLKLSTSDLVYYSWSLLNHNQ